MVFDEFTQIACIKFKGMVFLNTTRLFLIYRDVKSSYCNRVGLSFSRDRLFLSISKGDMVLITSVNA